MIVLELTHLKMDVTVSEPCDVIRVYHRTVMLNSGFAPMISYELQSQFTSNREQGEYKCLVFIKHGRIQNLEKHFLVFLI